MADDVRDNPDLHRFELPLDGHIAFSTYRRDDNVVTIVHTEVPKELNGRGIGSKLVRGILDIARQQGFRIRPLCSFVAAYMDKHPEYADLRV